MVLSLFKTSNQTNSSKKNRQAGQVGITTLLIMVVILAIAISLSQRTVLEQDIALTQEKATRVFNAAEYGVEEALYTIAEEDFDEGFDGAGYLEDISQLSIDGLTVDTSIQKSSVFEMYVEQGSVVEIPLDTPADGNTLAINWWYQEEVACDSDGPPALIISIYGDNEGRHFGYDPCNDTGESRDGNNLELVSPPGTVEDYSFNVSIILTGTDELVRVTPLYNSSKIQISATADAISDAQFEVNTRGIDPDAKIAQALNVLRSMPAAPSFMDYTLVSGESLSK